MGKRKDGKRSDRLFTTSAGDLGRITTMFAFHKIFDAGRIATGFVVSAMPCAILLSSCSVNSNHASNDASIVALADRASQSVAESSTTNSQGRIVLYRLPTNQNCYGPEQIVSGSDGNLYFTLVCHYPDRTIGKITTQGVISFISTPTSGSPVRLARGAPESGSIWYANDQCEFQRMFIGNDSFSQTYGGWFYCPSYGVLVTALAWGPNSTVWFSDYYYHEIAFFTAFRGEVHEFPLPAGRSALSLTLGPDHNMWFTDGSGSISEITNVGTITTYSPPQNMSEDILVKSANDKRLYVAGHNTGSSGTLMIGQVAPDGSVTPYTDSAVLGQPGSITVDLDHNIWVKVESDGYAYLVRYNVYTHRFLQAVSARAPELQEITTGSDGNIWFTDWQDYAIGVYKSKVLH